MGAWSGEAAERTPARVEHEINSITPGRRLAEDHGRHDVAAFLRQATDLGLDELNALNNT
ncbi:hypothetical protein OG402_33880 [Streptomyces anulatus]|uniref:hypothetical protein n=1 Tax=Streptomyces anulatus TaxID=1892 RepID=UPI00224F1327|nr:hypothetical protein [Streptomyces anulatus]MCX4605459.1 hypothetical protein [Streptomyces anulatus]